MQLGLWDRGVLFSSSQSHCDNFYNTFTTNTEINNHKRALTYPPSLFSRLGTPGVLVILCLCVCTVRLSLGFLFSLPLLLT